MAMLLSIENTFSIDLGLGGGSPINATGGMNFRPNVWAS